MKVEKIENRRNTKSKRESAMNNWVGFFTQLLLAGLVTERKKEKKKKHGVWVEKRVLTVKGVNSFFVRQKHIAKLLGSSPKDT